MSKLLLAGVTLLTSLWLAHDPAQAQLPGFPPMPGTPMDATVALDRAMRSSTLTGDGKPFHALLEIGTTGTPYSGRVEVWWVSSTKYRLVTKSPNFSQTRTVNGAQAQETDEGDYYPRWLQNFVLALIDPLPAASNFRGGGKLMVGSGAEDCLRRDDRPGGITDQTTWGVVCFSGSEPRLASVLTFNESLTFKDWKKFAGKQIARTYETDVLAYQPVVGHLTQVEELKQPDEAMFAIASPTTTNQMMMTAFVSTSKEESLLEKAPEIQWPDVREGKTDGYMIVYARTDRTGQVRETSKHNSDQPGLESFGMEQALKFKFKPLLIDGVAQQMEMPLVLHFTSHLADPIPVLSVADMQKQIISCGPATGGTKYRVRVSVDEQGKATGIIAVGPVDGRRFMAVNQAVHQCRFRPYVVNAKPTYYKGDMDVSIP